MTHTNINKLSPLNHSGYVVIKNKAIRGPRYKSYYTAQKNAGQGFVSTMKAAIAHQFKGSDNTTLRWDYTRNDGKGRVIE